MLLASVCAVAGRHSGRATDGRLRRRQRGNQPSSSGQLEFRWTDIVNRRMASLANVEMLDVVAGALHRCHSGFIVFPVNQFHLQRSIVTIHRCVVVAIALSAHARPFSVFSQQPLKVIVAVLTPSIAVDDQAPRRLT